MGQAVQGVHIKVLMTEDPLVEFGAENTGGAVSTSEIFAEIQLRKQAGTCLSYTRSRDIQLGIDS